MTVSQHQSPPHKEDGFQSQYEHDAHIIPPANRLDKGRTEWSDNTVGGFQNEDDDSDSSTEPESDDVEAHMQWEVRQEMREIGRAHV